MVLSIVMLLLILVVAYFHWLQGLVTATLSAISAVIAVLVAFSLYEPIVTAMSPGKFADSAHGMMLIALFAVVYITLRIIFDLVIPGNVRFPSMLDKIGGAVMGLIAAIFAAGLITVAAQSMPFGPSIAGYARYAIRGQQHTVVKTSETQNEDRQIYDQLVKPRIDGPDAVHDSMILPVDDWVVNFVSLCSGGSTSGMQSFRRIHPDYLQELFGNRIGIEVGAKRSANPVGKSDAVSLLGVYTVDSIPEGPAEFPDVVKKQFEEAIPPTLKPDANQTILVVRILFSNDAADTDSLVRVSMGSVRLVAAVNGTYRNYFPIGTVDAGSKLMVSSADDFLFVTPGKAADFLFVVDSAALPDLKQLPAQIPNDSDLFVEAKRYGRVSLAGRAVDRLSPSDEVQVVRKKFAGPVAPPSPASPAAPAMPAAPASGGTPPGQTADAETLRKRLIGDWNTNANGQATVVSFNADGSFLMTVQSGDTPLKVTGKWSVQSAGPEGLKILRTLDSGGQPQEATISWAPNTTDAATLKDLTGQTLQLTRKP